MSTTNAGTAEEYDEPIDTVAPIRCQLLVGSSPDDAKVRRWTRAWAADTGLVPVTADVDYGEPATGEYDTGMFLHLLEQRHPETGVFVITGDVGYREPAASEHDRTMFLRLVEQWHAERVGATSSMAEIIACPSYLRIIGMGWRALPLIFERLEREGNEPDHWCAALEAVTGDDPVPEDAHGDTVRIAQAWIAWYEARVAWSFPTSTTRIIE